MHLMAERKNNILETYIIPNPNPSAEEDYKQLRGYCERMPRRSRKMPPKKRPDGGKNFPRGTSAKFDEKEDQKNHRWKIHPKKHKNQPTTVIYITHLFCLPSDPHNPSRDANDRD
jgi:hypothetical protein